MDKVGIILVNYNGYKDTIECINSLQKISYKNYIVIVIDNASTQIPTDTQAKYLKENSLYYRTARNLGFSGGNNIGIKIAKENNCNFVLLLNNDTTVSPNFLDALMAIQLQYANVGIVTGKINFYYSKDKIWSAGGMYNRNTGVTTQYGGYESKLNSSMRRITFATGCLMLIPMEVIDKVGELTETYFLYSEDTDYCQRVLDAGYYIYYCPESIIYHKVSATVGNATPIQERYMMRNNLYMISKYGRVKGIAFLCFFLFTIKEIIRGRKHLKPTLKGLNDFVHRKTGKI
ncbi:MAG: glycosyltransferase family 2 protein [Lachnospiraceae bacterium]|nr:MAG: glycosyltransferase family 2 protein [Lachnospiraceae bacterium]